MNRVVYKFLFIVVSLLIVFLFLNKQVSAIDVDLDKKNSITLDELIAGAKKEGKIVFYSAHSPFVTELLLKRFSETYPFVKTDFVRGSGMVIGQRIYSEKSRGIENMDTVYSGAAELYPDWRKHGYLARLDNLPEWGNIIDLAKGKDGCYVSFVFMTHVMAWNKKVYKDEEVPADLGSLLSPIGRTRLLPGILQLQVLRSTGLVLPLTFGPKTRVLRANPAGLGSSGWKPCTKMGTCCLGRWAV